VLKERGWAVRSAQGGKLEFEMHIIIIYSEKNILR
jgi:hypothetical protein